MGKLLVAEFQGTLWKRIQHTYESAIKKSGVRAQPEYAEPRRGAHSFSRNLFSIMVAIAD